MFGLSKHGPDSRYGVVVDIGSSTVTAAIVLSAPESSIPVVIWSYKERVVLKESGTQKDSIKAMTAAIMNTFLQIGSEGVSVLGQYDRNGVMEECNIAVAAPWSYSVTQRVSSSADNPFKITSAILDELARTAEEKSMSSIAEDDIAQHLGLSIISESTLNVSLNGYITKNPYGKSAREVSISRLITAVENTILAIVKESHAKVLPRTSLHIQTFMYQFFATMEHLEPNNSDYCMVDIGGEATELGIVRDGELAYVTHCNYGTHTLARSIANSTKGSFSEIISGLQHDHEALITSFPQTTRAAIENIQTEQYKSLADLFINTGDALAIPKEILLHTDSGFETIGQEAIAAGSKRATSIHHNVRNITAELFAATNDEETKILLSSYVFHKRLHIRHRNS